MNGRMLGDKIAETRQQQTLHERRMRVNGQGARQLAVFNIQDFLIQGIEGAAERPLHSLAFRRERNTPVETLE